MHLLAGSGRARSGRVRRRSARGFGMSRLTKPAWTNRFQEPTLAHLRAGLAKDKASLFDLLRTRLLEVEGMKESISWQGVPWRWTLIYSTDGEDATGSKAWAYLVPDPERLQVCITLRTDQIQGAGVQRLKKWVRDGIVFARSVAGVCWPTYEVTTKAQVDDLFELIARKQKASDARVQHA